MKSLVESILDDNFDQSFDKAYEKRLKDITALRDDFVKYIQLWCKLKKDGAAYYNDKWDIKSKEWWGYRGHIRPDEGMRNLISKELTELIKKHHLTDILLINAVGSRRTGMDSVCLFIRKNNSHTKPRVINIDYDDDEQSADVWIEDPEQVMIWLQN